jgi:mono/diheme cytochrome c family protein
MNSRIFKFSLMKTKGARIVLPLLLLVSTACTKKADPGAANFAAPMSQEQLIEQGKTTFQLNCVSCHGADPRQDGPVGPALAGSSLALIEARVMRTAYPEGYKPKRSTSTMVALPHLKNDLNALYAYLNSFSGAGAGGALKSEAPSEASKAKSKVDEICTVSATSECKK